MYITSIRNHLMHTNYPNIIIHLDNKKYLLYYCRLLKLMAELTDRNIIEISSIDEIPFDVCDENDLVAFDFHCTLVIEGMAIMREVNAEIGFQFIDEIKSKVGDERVTYLFDNLEYKLVEEVVRHKISSLQKRGVNVTCLTGTRTGFYTPDCTKSVEDRYITTLKDLGINFNSDHFNNMIFQNIHPGNPKYINQLIDPEMELLHITSGALVKSGMIFTNNVSKGLVLGKVFKRIAFFPKRFILIDDKMKNHITTYEAIQSINRKYNINITFVGYLYRKAANLIDNKTNTEIINIQKEYLLRDDYKLLSDNEAMKMIM